jgi:hypothetical protein
VNERRVAQVVGIIFGAAGREVTDAILDAWAVALKQTPDGDDVLEVAAQLARGTDFATLAQFYKALMASRRRRALEAESSLRVLEGPGGDFAPLSHPANWRAFVAGSRRAALQLGKPAPRFPDELRAGVSLNSILDDMFRAPDPAEAWNGGGDPEAA